MFYLRLFLAVLWTSFAAHSLATGHEFFFLLYAFFVWLDVRWLRLHWEAAESLNEGKRPTTKP